ncbi:MAG: bifunctional phosphoribosylaminoimidazolecarboxamide formyltransferase/inosine monophosphate cyclohydrolase [Rhodospirillaceae bacterium]|nr:bifunctional phosphoribosylaminoimidazolecarboxamide formyltransferase/inosine monophosphate cyclohydrolase [Rhodospirillaceae bacterium]|tara:strand:- start:74981 stop:76567 length:1587 start_codon:yes stop_codon:yes gene_type:complete
MTDSQSSRITRALISVSDKQNLEKLGKFLSESGVEILSTGGSAKALSDAGIPVKEVGDHTGFPEIMNGRVKTLHPKIHGGILARRSDETHLAAMRDHDIAPIDMIVVNLYPFEETVAAGADFETCIENIDIGGPSLIRAAAKNHESITVITDTLDYDAVIAEMKENEGATTPELRRQLAARAYAKTAAYDAAIADWFAKQNGDEFPQRHTLAGNRAQIMRYGENPHQSAAFYRTADDRPGVATASQLQGKELSYNNLNDTDAAFELVAEFSEPAVAIIKHANPCGVAIGNSLSDAYNRALKCDPVSAFGGIIAVNRELDADAAKEMAELFLEVIIAPEVTDAAKEILAAKKNLRVLATNGMPASDEPGMTLKMLAGGYLLQSRDAAHVTAGDLKTVTKREPSEQELADLIFAFTVCKHVKSNAIVYAKDGATVGIGAGQMSRVDSCRIAAQKSADAAEAAGEGDPLAIGSVVASDAFFPFADGLLTAAAAGATAVIQPGGSIRDDEVIAAADDNDLAMVLTGIRHFRH